MSKQITITVINEYKEQPLRLLHESGRTVLYTMRESGMVLPAFCDGMGKCGRCRVRFDKNAPLPTPTERAVLKPELLRQGYRLACMARPIRDCVVECAFVQEPVVEVVTQSRLPEHKCEAEARNEAQLKKDQIKRDQIKRDQITRDQIKKDQIKKDQIKKEQLKEGQLEEEYISANRSSGEKCAGKTMIAADIGTTTIAMQLLDVASGAVLGTYTCMNPQRGYGTDVISRIQAASDGDAERLRELVCEALRNGVRYLLAEIEKKQENEILCIACNTTMGHIFLGYDTSGLGKSPFQPVELGMVETQWEGLQTFVLPGISAFVGGDIVAGLYACGLKAEAGEESWLFIDLGTNAEMVMGKGERIVATAAAAGPAFEGRGADGATGADRIAAVAQLLEQGMVDETGLLAEPYFGDGIDVELVNGCGFAPEEEDKRKTVYIEQDDIRQLQMAKAAVRAGIHFLMKRLGIKEFGQIRKVYVAGGMGFYLRMDAAVRIGLLPEYRRLQEKRTGPEEEEVRRQTDGGEIQAVGNTSLAGAGLLGRWLTENSKEAFDEECWHTQSVEVFQLAEEECFEQVYVEYMNFPVK